MDPLFQPTKHSVRSVLSRLLGWVTGLVVAGAPWSAAADVLVDGNASSLSAARADALIIDRGERGYSIIERLTVHSGSARLIWLHPVPGRPTVRAGPDLLDDLAKGALRQSRMQEPLRSHPFGPSVLTLWTRRHESEAPELRSSAPPPARPLLVDAVDLFYGATSTATTAEGRTTRLPRALDGFLRRYNVRLISEDVSELALYLNRGWSILAMALYDRDPNPSAPARIGTVRLDFREGPTIYPLARRRIPFAFYVLADGLRVPELPVRLLADGNNSSPAAPVAVGLASSLSSNDPLHFLLSETHGLAVPVGSVLTQSLLHLQEDQLEQVGFGPPDTDIAEQLQPMLRQPNPARGMAWCILLGLTPLVLTPESLLVAWVQGRARERARDGIGGRWGVKLWAIWALVVAFYWLFAVDGLARIAALGPMMIGTFQLAFPFTERRPHPVRSRFRRTKRDPASGAA